MGQEQSYVAHGGVAQVRRHKEDFQEPVHRRASSIEKERDRERDEIRRYRTRRSADSFKSDNSNESGGYLSGSSGYRSGSSGFRSDGSAEYYCAPLYKNDHYKDVSKELYKPVKIKDRRHKLQLFDDDKRGYLSEEGKGVQKSAAPTPKRAGIRNYTPKILETGDQKRIESWI